MRSRTYGPQGSLDADYAGLIPRLHSRLRQPKPTEHLPLCRVVVDFEDCCPAVSKIAIANGDAARTKHVFAGADIGASV